MTVHARPEEHRGDRSGPRAPNRQVDRAGPDALRALQRGAGNRAVAEAVAVQRLKNRSSAPLSGLLRNLSFGREQQRKAQPAQPVQVGGIITAIHQVTTASTNGNQLTGRHYVGMTQPAHGQQLSMRGKLILFFSGSHGSAEKYSEEIALRYCMEGADVLAFNYRGFGGSSNTGATDKARRKAATPTEHGLYDDGMAMWQYATGLVTADNVILHGYSLGGAAASHVAKELKTQGVNFGGLVLHSSIANVGRAATGGKPTALKPGFWLGGQLGHAMVGKMSTRENLRALSNTAGGTNVPIHLMSGRGGDDDHLGLDMTGLGAYAAQLGFTSTSTSVTPNADHTQGSEHLKTAMPQLRALFGNQGGPQQNFGLGPLPNIPLPQPPVQVDDAQQ